MKKLLSLFVLIGIVGTTVFAAPISVPSDLASQNFAIEQVIPSDYADNNVFAESNESFTADDAYLFASVDASQLTDVEAESVQGAGNFGWIVWACLAGAGLGAAAALASSPLLLL
jgi:hypothetical protein